MGRNEYKNFETLLPQLEGNVGLLFTKGDIAELRDLVLEQKVAAPAKAGAIAPCDVIVPAGYTGLEPTQTAFLQALNIATRLNKGQIQIQAPLLQKLKIHPFSYGLGVISIYDDGSVYAPAVLDFNYDSLSKRIATCATRIAQVSLQIGYPCFPSVPHSLARAFKNLLSIAVATEVTFERAQEIKDLLNMDPEELAKLQAASAPVAEDAPAEEEKQAEEEEEESDDDMGFGLFD